MEAHSRRNVLFVRARGPGEGPRRPKPARFATVQWCRWMAQVNLVGTAVRGARAVLHASVGRSIW